MKNIFAKAIKKCKDKYIDNTFNRNRRKWLGNLHERLLNNDFTIISNNCIAGIIYHDLGLPFLSPTINLFFKECTDFVLFCENLNAYTNCPLVDVSAEEKRQYPCGKLVPEGLPSIVLCFQHYTSFNEASDAWERRCRRINMNNLFFIYEFYNGYHSISSLVDFDKLPYANKIALTHDYVDGVACAKTISCYKEINRAGRILEFDGISGKRYLDEFDYISFLNA